VIRNNLTMDLDIDANAVTEDHNLVFDDPAALFVDPANQDLHLRDDATAAIDMGTADDAPAVDRDGIPRPQGAAVDLGAYEWHDGTVEPVDGGPGGPPDVGPGSDSGGPIGDGGGPVGDAGPGGPAPEDDGGCSCSTSEPLAGDLLAGLIVFAALASRRRRMKGTGS